VNPPSCAEVEEQIDLYALHECDPATGEAVAAHLARCRSCARAYQETCRLLGLLDLHARQEDALARLRNRIAAESWQPSRFRQTSVRRMLALAALLLLTLGLTWWAEPGPPLAPPSGGGTLVAMLAPQEAGFKVEPRAMAMEAATTRFLPADLRRELEEGKRTGRLPPPPTVNLELRLDNRGNRDLVLLLEEGRYRLGIDLKGPGVETVPVPGGGVGPFGAIPPRLRVLAGGTRTLPMVRLSENLAGQCRYVYWIEPGRYTLAVTLEVQVAGQATPLRVTTPPMAIRVEAAR
jgi:hypothetical protein